MATLLTVKLLLNDIEKIKAFNAEVSNLPFDVDIVRGRYTIDAKSLLGIFSLDLSTPVEVSFHTEDKALVEELLEKYGA